MRKKFKLITFALVLIMVVVAFLHTMGWHFAAYKPVMFGLGLLAVANELVFWYRFRYRKSH
jgi:hypothetical protein